MNSRISNPAFLLPIVLIGLVAGISGGWIRLGSLIIPLAEAGLNHGLLMVGGFLGTLISIERAMIMKKKAWLIIPFFSGISTLFFLFELGQAGLGALLAGSLGLSLIMHFQTMRHPHFHSVLLYLGAVCWFLGNLFAWHFGMIAAGSTWWIGFLLFTIVGERLELSQFLPVPTWSKKALGGFLGLFFIGLTVPFHGMGNEVMGFGILLISAWLLIFDMAKVSARKKAQFRYIGIGLRAGYLWLGAQGLILLLMESHPLFYDMFLHTFFLGFVFSMIWAHAPIIFPTIFGIRETPYHPILWITWAGFQLSLLGRILASVLGEFELRQIFGVANGYLILIQFILMAAVVGWKIQHRRSLGKLT
jgi:hypothetical protein